MQEYANCLVIYGSVKSAGNGDDGDGDGDGVEGDDGEPDYWPPKEACQRVVIAFFPENISVLIVFTSNHKRLKKKNITTA